MLVGYGDNDLSFESGFGVLRVGENNRPIKVNGPMISLAGVSEANDELPKTKASSTGIGDLGSLLLDAEYRLLGFAPYYHVSNELGSYGTLYINLTTPKAKAFLSNLN